MSVKRKNSIFLVIVFFICLWLPFVFSDKKGGKVSLTENRTLATFPDFSSIHGLRSGLENWINDNVGFREQFSKMNVFLNYNLFHTSPTEKVIIGKNGWFFYTPDNNIDIARGTYPLTQEMLENIKSNQEKIQSELKKRGIEYVLVLTPSKTSIYPEMINGCDCSTRQTPIDIVTDYLKKNTTINVINTKPALLEAKKDETVFFKTDTHWNYEGAYIGYKTLAQNLYQNGFISVPPISVEKVLDTHKGEFSAMMGDVDLLPAERINVTKINNPKAVEVVDENLLNAISEEQAEHNFNPYGNHFYENTSLPDKKILMYGDSFFGGWNIPQLMAENCSNLNFIWSDYVKNNTVQMTKPDIVIYERTERYIYTLANPADPALFYEPLDNPQAEIVSTTTPTKIERGKKYDINITVKNTGTQSWSEKQKVRLCIFQDSDEDRGYRVKIPDGVEVKPGEQYTFVLQDFHAPAEESTYLVYQMVQDGVDYFGEKKRVDITIE